MMGANSALYAPNQSDNDIAMDEALCGGLQRLAQGNYSEANANINVSSTSLVVT